MKTPFKLQLFYLVFYPNIYELPELQRDTFTERKFLRELRISNADTAGIAIAPTAELRKSANAMARDVSI